MRMRKVRRVSWLLLGLAALLLSANISAGGASAQALADTKDSYNPAAVALARQEQLRLNRSQRAELSRLAERFEGQSEAAWAGLQARMPAESRMRRTRSGAFQDSALRQTYRPGASSGLLGGRGTGGAELAELVTELTQARAAAVAEVEAVLSATQRAAWQGLERHRSQAMQRARSQYLHS